MKSQALDDCFARTFRTEEPEWVCSLGFQTKAADVSGLMGLTEGARLHKSKE